MVNWRLLPVPNAARRPSSCPHHNVPLEPDPSIIAVSFRQALALLSLSCFAFRLLLVLVGAHCILLSFVSLRVHMSLCGAWAPSSYMAVFILCTRVAFAHSPSAVRVLCTR
ncbi:hypothetical protein C8Q79DRAFT_541285 [Trametes meyenii]|nr:hypothetical protein C8Q79DRAFT_541285 [Trametes meyenii]